jgi:hypothetical protein
MELILRRVYPRNIFCLVACVCHQVNSALYDTRTMCLYAYLTHHGADDDVGIFTYFYTLRFYLRYLKFLRRLM